MTLLESLQCILDEGKRADYFVSQFASKLDALYDKLKSDHSFDMEVAEENAKKVLHKAQTETTDEKAAKKELLRIILDEIEQKFPVIAKNMYWVMKEYSDNKFLFEDFPRVEAQLKFFDKAKNKHLIEEPNIQKYTYEQFTDLLSNFSEEDLKSDHQRRQEARNVVQKEIDKAEKGEKTDILDTNFEIVWKTPELIVFHPFTYEAECAIVPAKNRHDKSCGWCTRAAPDCSMWAGKGEGYFNNYNKDGPLFPMHDLVNDEWYQAHFETNQFKDWADHEVDLDTLMSKAPHIKEWVVDYLSKNPYIAKKSSRRWQEYLDKSKLDPEMADWLTFYGSNTEFLDKMNSEGKNISEKLKEQIVSMEPMLIKKIKSPSEELQWRAVSRNISAFRATCPDKVKKYVLENNEKALDTFRKVTVKTQDGARVLTGSDLLSEDDVKLFLSHFPEHVSILFYNPEYKKFQTKDILKYATMQDAKLDYPKRVDVHSESLIPEDWKPEFYALWNKIYNIGEKDKWQL